MSGASSSAAGDLAPLETPEKRRKTSDKQQEDFFIVQAELVSEIYEGQINEIVRLLRADHGKIINVLAFLKSGMTMPVVEVLFRGGVTPPLNSDSEDDEDYVDVPSPPGCADGRASPMLPPPH